MVLVGDDVDDCVTCRPFWLSVPLTVDSFLLLDRVLVAFVTLMLRVGRSWTVTVWI